MELGSGAGGGEVFQKKKIRNFPPGAHLLFLPFSRSAGEMGGMEKLGDDKSDFQVPFPPPLPRGSLLDRGRRGGEERGRGEGGWEPLEVKRREGGRGLF